MSVDARHDDRAVIDAGVHRAAPRRRRRRGAPIGRGRYPARVPDLTDLGDAPLVVSIGRYAQDALREVYRRYAGAVHALARRLLRERFLADEVVQEVFLHLWRHPDRFDPARGSLRAYLLAQAHGRSVDLIRSEGARRRREQREARLAVVTTDPLGPVPGERGDDPDVRGVLGALPEPERRAIALAYFGGHTYREVAALLGEPEGTVKSRIRSGLLRMRERLAGSERRP
jgi:RNA polymerase sigma-70 factor (ECF subfamily)